MALNITAEQYAVAQAYADAGNYQAGWNYLALCGDKYADNAAAVTSGNATGIDKAFEVLVKNHWLNTAGADAYATKFDRVATQHFQQYVAAISPANNYKLPDSQQIEQSYRTAVTDAGLPPTTAIDGVITSSFGKIADLAWPGAKSNGPDWTDGLRMEDARQVPSNVFSDIGFIEAGKIILDDIFATVTDLNNLGSAGDVAAAAMSELKTSMSKSFIEFGLGLGNTINGIEQGVANTFTAAQTFVQRFGDPLTLDLNGNGIETVPLKVPPLLFDINASGIKISTGWIAPDDGLLVLDRNGNGRVDSGAELFGDATPKYDAAGNPTAGRTADGFAALAQEDTNADGIVNALDANFSALQVWQDLNQDGISQPDELKSLAEAGIASFNVARTLHSQMLPSGNQMSDMGTYTRVDGTTGATASPQGMADINLALDTFHRTFADSIPLTSAAQALPDMQGSGKVRDLREAASLQTAAGATLSAALGNYDSAATREGQLAQIDALLSAWAATAEFGTLQSRAAANGYTFTVGLDAVRQSHLAALEAFNGRGYFKMPWEGASFGESARQGLTVGWGGNPKAMYGALWGQASLLDQAYAALKESVYRALLPQTRLKPYLDAIGLTLDADGNFSLDTGYREAANDGWYTDRRAA